MKKDTCGSPPPTATKQCAAATWDMPRAYTRTGSAKLHATASTFVSQICSGARLGHQISALVPSLVNIRMTKILGKLALGMPMVHLDFLVK